jgi:2-polyprenyl-3-methyl-5-hydroxy-6-metoxy-1,4-benzoquinol methylase
LIKRCKDDLTKGYWDIKSKKITLKVKAEFIAEELVPRYTAIYKVTIKSGEVVIQVETAGVTVEVHTNTKKCKATAEVQVQDQVMKELVLSGMR